MAGLLVSRFVRFIVFAEGGESRGERVRALSGVAVRRLMDKEDVDVMAAMLTPSGKWSRLLRPFCSAFGLS